MSQISWLLLAWIALSVLGVVTNLRFVWLTIGDKLFLHQHQLNGVRMMLVEIHFRESFTHLLVKLMFMVLGVWSLYLRQGASDIPLTMTGYVTFGTFFAMIAALTLVDIYNFRKRRELVEKLMREKVVFITIPEPAKS